MLPKIGSRYKVISTARFPYEYWYHYEHYSDAIFTMNGINITLEKISLSCSLCNCPCECGIDDFEKRYRPIDKIICIKEVDLKTLLTTPVS